ncbi:hypothetical protein [Bradyrhizobium sp. CB3481]|uniref:hypothetical protein n=1 Tax=Bradyrhizobium sp. CB3481 TaxID=3039158 RepID=UPI0024B19979|nr:hypothetical protein [Bradyrhizobium sp. CB3481]WFU19454.1 hypothetical protein QA643_14555 [Bradyrhizobium sp. CB3481]
MIGSEQPTVQSAAWDGSTLTTLTVRDGEDVSGDGTVPRVSALPLELDFVNATYVPNTHSALQSDEVSFGHMRSVLTEADLDPRTYRAGLGRSFSLYLEHAYRSGQNVRIEATATENVQIIGGVLERADEAAKPRPVKLRPTGDRHRVDLPLEPVRIACVSPPTNSTPSKTFSSSSPTDHSEADTMNESPPWTWSMKRHSPIRSRQFFISGHFNEPADEWPYAVEKLVRLQDLVFEIKVTTRPSNVIKLEGNVASEHVKRLFAKILTDFDPKKGPGGEQTRGHSAVPPLQADRSHGERVRHLGRGLDSETYVAALVIGVLVRRASRMGRVADGRAEQAGRVSGVVCEVVQHGRGAGRTAVLRLADRDLGQAVHTARGLLLADIDGTLQCVAPRYRRRLSGRCHDDRLQIRLEDDRASFRYRLFEVAIQRAARHLRAVTGMILSPPGGLRPCCNRRPQAIP